MYRKDLRLWKSEEYDSDEIRHAEAPENKEDPASMFIRADILVEKSQKGRGNVEAVYLMEEAAKKGYSRAAFAMAQMFEYGWAVHQSKSRSLEWYKKAADMGDAYAISYLEKIRRKKKKFVITLIAAAVLAAALVALLMIFVPKLIPVKGIKVSDNTDLSEHTDIMDFAKEQTRLVDEMDDEDVKSGKKRSNRLVVIYEGEGIDLSDFDALWVISDGNGYLLIQFDDSKETDRCLKALKKNKNVISVVEDNYSQMASKAPELGDLHSSGYPYKSPETGFEYMSWGIEYMGIDKLAAWTMKQKTRSVTVAVLDTGSHPAKGFEDHYLEGIDLVETNNQNGWDDGHGHGTHVAGTVMDCTRGLDVKILPIRVLNDEGAGASSTIVTGLQIASALKADVVNMSLGMSGINENACPTGRDPVVERMVANGICVVVSSGNESMDAKESCSGHQDAPIVVGACQPNGTMADFSNYGKSVDVCAPGVEILSFLPDGSLTAWDGTSMAAPHISGLVALLKCCEPTCNFTPRQIEYILGVYSASMGDKDFFGEGIPNAALFAGD